MATSQINYGLMPPFRRASGDASTRRSDLIAALAILATAAALTLPACFNLRTNDSFCLDWVWLDQFARELGNGTLYPRWLPMSHHGLGSPVFYYYPPLAFYVGGLFASIGMTIYASLIATFFIAYILGGLGTYFWLKPQSRSPLLGAIIYVIVPYHAFNFYARGAVAEALATAALPFVMIGIRKLARGEPGGFKIVAANYAALIMSHLPLALLASVFLIAPYAFLQTWAVPRRLATAGAALGIGISLAAVYLVPALLLEPYRDAAKLWDNPILRPSNWTFWNPEFRTWRNYVAVLVVSMALAIPLASLALRHRSKWAMIGLLYIFLAIGVLPAIWALPLLRSVQFPFRILPLAEFALATSLAMSITRPAERILACLALLAITVATIASTYPPSASLAELQALHPDAPENLPPGNRPYSWPSIWALQVATDHDRTQFSNGITVVRLFYFPAWRVVCAGRRVSPFPDPRNQLLAYHGPPGCVLNIEQTAPEKVGWTITLLTLVGLLFTSFGHLLFGAKKKTEPLPDEG